MQKIYTVLPPPIEELNEVLAFIFTGPCQPTEDDFQRIPLLVCQNKVGKALEWLKLNHKDYADLEISYENLNLYPEDLPPVVINYRHSASNKIQEATSVHDMELENGTEEGMCPFTVHTLTSEEYDTTRPEILKAIAMKHLDDYIQHSFLITPPLVTPPYSLLSSHGCLIIALFPPSFPSLYRVFHHLFCFIATFCILHFRDSIKTHYVCIHACLFSLHNLMNQYDVMKSNQSMFIFTH